MHGGAGDDQMSGAEALPDLYQDPASTRPLLFDPNKNEGEFADYDESAPLKSVDGHALNFDATENGGHDGDDALFGDDGNDWIVGGTDRDHLWGGKGSDLLDADDDKSTNGGLNDQPDNDPDDFNADLTYGGGGKDIHLGNTGADRLIDWTGEFNSYVVPFAPFGEATVVRKLQPQLPNFLYALAKSDGADQTRVGPGLGASARNGEPFGEDGLFLQEDNGWRDQTGAPEDPQAGNKPGGSKDQLR